MHKFTDTSGKEWQIELNVGAIKRVRASMGLDLLALDKGDPPLLTCLGMDVVLLCDVLFALVEPVAEAAGITDADFGARLGGDAILHAQQAFFKELTDFFLSLGRRELAVALQKQQEMIAAAVNAMTMKLDDMNPAAEVERIFGAASMSSPGSAE